MKQTPLKLFISLDVVVDTTTGRSRQTFTRLLAPDLFSPEDAGAYNFPVVESIATSAVSVVFAFALTPPRTVSVAWEIDPAAGFNMIVSVRES
ncbi:hypothetical protein DSECCO2_632010 [anaerobic digester metagenome]